MTTQKHQLSQWSVNLVSMWNCFLFKFSLQLQANKQQNLSSLNDLPIWRAVPLQPGHSEHHGQNPWLSARRYGPQWPDHHIQAPHTSSLLHQFCSWVLHIHFQNNQPLEAFHRSAISQGSGTGVQGKSATEQLGDPENTGGPWQGYLKSVCNVGASQFASIELTSMPSTQMQRDSIWVLLYQVLSVWESELSWTGIGRYSETG